MDCPGEARSQAEAARVDAEEELKARDPGLAVEVREPLEREVRRPRRPRENEEDRVRWSSRVALRIKPLPRRGYSSLTS